MRKKKLRDGRDYCAYLLLLPAMVLMVGLVFFPILVTFEYSLRKMKLTAPGDTPYVGLENYRAVLQSDDFLYALQNTAFIVVLMVVLCMVCAMALSLMLNVEHKMRGILTALAIVPWALPPVVNGILWKWIFYPGFGFLNKILINLHLIDAPVQWLSQRWSLLAIIAIVAAWRNIPFCTVVYLSALQSIPSSITEAVMIDGANNRQTFRHIILPLLMPATGIVLTSTSISAINIFDEIVSLSGYSNLGKTLLIQNYLTTFSFLDFGVGSALSYVIMLVSGVLGLLYIRNVNREVHYL